MPWRLWIKLLTVYVVWTQIFFSSSFASDFFNFWDDMEDPPTDWSTYEVAAIDESQNSLPEQNSAESTEENLFLESAILKENINASNNNNVANQNIILPKPDLKEDPINGDASIKTNNKKKRGTKRKHENESERSSKKKSFRKEPVKETEKFICKAAGCDLSFNRKKELFHHVDNVHIKSCIYRQGQNISCIWNECLATPQHKGKLRDHVARRHVGYAYRKCSYCTHREYFSYKMNEHLEKYHAQELAEDDPPEQVATLPTRSMSFILPPSPSPILDAGIICILLNKGVLYYGNDKYEYTLTSYDVFAQCIAEINSKQSAVSPPQRKASLGYIFAFDKTKNAIYPAPLSVLPNKRVSFDERMAAMKKFLVEQKINF